MYGFNNYNAYTSYLAPQNTQNHLQNYLGSQQLSPQTFFAQPSGQLFSVNNFSEIGNIPVQEGFISAIINPNESVLYLKTIQNGKSSIIEYELRSTSIEQKESSSIDKQISDLNDIIIEIMSRVESLESTNGGK